MIKKAKHPSGRGERMALKAKKDKVHSNASPVFKLLQEKEILDAAATKRTKRIPSRYDPTGLGSSVPPTDVHNQVL